LVDVDYPKMLDGGAAEIVPAAGCLVVNLVEG